MKQDFIELFVPGRLCLFGEHSDWAGQMRKFNSEIVPGKALVACINEGIYATARVCEDLKLSTVMPDGTTKSCEYPMDPSLLRTVASEGGYFSYIAGVAAYISTFYNIGGVELDCFKVTLPQKKGLSSSAAICVLAARAFNRLYGLNLTVRGEMEAAYHGEQMTPSRCGRLDQACAYGKGIVDMTFDGDILEVSPVKIGAPMYFLFADLKAEKDTVEILRDLNSAYPYPRTEMHRDLHLLLGKYNEDHITKVREAIGDGDAKRLGALMTEAQEMFDRYATPLSPKELRAEKLHSVLTDPSLQKFIYGGKGVGSQGDGTVQFLAKSKQDVHSLNDYLTNTLKLDCYSFTAPKTESVRKAVMPIAGYGTRMYPASKVMRKELFPIVDTDGHTKPALLIVIEELIKAGIEEICLIIRPGDEDLYLSLFQPLEDENLWKLQRGLQSYENKLAELKEKIVFAYQEQTVGFGHAVLQSSRFADDDPALLVLGDHLYSSKSNRSCFNQMIDAYEKTRKMTIGLFEIPEDDVVKYGIAKGNYLDDEKKLIELDALIEKPTVEYAKSDLGVDGKQLAVFLYVLTPDVYKSLNHMFRDGRVELGEFQLTPALDDVIKTKGACGVVVDGERFDIGLPEKYRSTVANYGR
jgi:UTP-glucose-1-phosphate uridylyltransferase/mevalonate kinase